MPRLTHLVALVATLSPAAAVADPAGDASLSWQLRPMTIDTVARIDSAAAAFADRNGNLAQATYSGGQLQSVAFPDGRMETYSYHTDGKLASITEVGVGGGASRTWSYSWIGLDLARVDGPDGRAWKMAYGRFGFLTRLRRVGTDGSEGAHRALAWAHGLAGRDRRRGSRSAGVAHHQDGHVVVALVGRDP